MTTSSKNKGEWIHLDRNQRLLWLDDASERWFRQESYTRQRNRTIEIPGNLIDDELSFYCAIGEAVNGPGGYFGPNLLGFDDCLFGGFGLDSPYKIVWLNSDISRTFLSHKILDEWVDAVSHLPTDDLEREICESCASTYDSFFDMIVAAIKSVPKRSSHVKASLELK